MCDRVTVSGWPSCAWENGSLIRKKDGTCTLLGMMICTLLAGGMQDLQGPSCPALFPLPRVRFSPSSPSPFVLGNKKVHPLRSIAASSPSSDPIPVDPDVRLHRTWDRGGNVQTWWQLRALSKEWRQLLDVRGAQSRDAEMGRACGRGDGGTVRGLSCHVRCVKLSCFSAFGGLDRWDPTRCLETSHLVRMHGKKRMNALLSPASCSCACSS